MSVKLTPESKTAWAKAMEGIEVQAITTMADLKLTHLLSKHLQNQLGNIDKITVVDSWKTAMVHQLLLRQQPNVLASTTRSP